MKTGLLSIERVLNMERWQTLQDAMAKVTKLAVITVNYKGVPVTRHSAPRPFCQMLRADPSLECNCQKCDSRGGLEAVRTSAPYIYLCHCGIVDIAIPIMVGGHYIGALMAGQVRLPQGEEAGLEQIMIPPNRRLFDSEQMTELYQAIPVLPFQDVQAIADMFFHLCSYVIEEAVAKQSLVELYEQMNSGAPTEQEAFRPMDQCNSRLELAQKLMRDTVTKTYINTSDSEMPACRNPILKPALDYIYQNKGESVTQKQMAALCHVSTSYFSRLFNKVIGEGFAIFLARQKVEWSKRLLENTEFSVSQISDQLGFSSSGYYIKTFKRFEHVTPAVYRKFYENGG